MAKPMTAEETILVNQKGVCPKCSSEYFLHGPRGGFAENIRCVQCGAEIWFAPPFTPEWMERNEPKAYKDKFRLADELDRTGKVLVPDLRGSKLAPGGITNVAAVFDDMRSDTLAPGPDVLSAEADRSMRRKLLILYSWIAALGLVVGLLIYKLLHYK